MAPVGSVRPRGDGIRVGQIRDAVGGDDRRDQSSRRKEHDRWPGRGGASPDDVKDGHRARGGGERHDAEQEPTVEVRPENEQDEHGPEPPDGAPLDFDEPADQRRAQEDRMDVRADVVEGTPHRRDRDGGERRDGARSSEGPDGGSGQAPDTDRNDELPEGEAGQPRAALDQSEQDVRKPVLVHPGAGWRVERERIGPRDAVREDVLAASQGDPEISGARHARSPPDPGEDDDRQVRGSLDPSGR